MWLIGLVPTGVFLISLLLSWQFVRVRVQQKKFFEFSIIELLSATATISSLFAISVLFFAESDWQRNRDLDYLSRYHWSAFGGQDEIATIVFKNNTLTKDDVLALSRVKSYKIGMLSLEGVAFSEGALASFPGDLEIDNLNLSYSAIDSCSIHLLKDIKARRLDLSHTSVDGSTLNALGPNYCLQELDLRHCNLDEDMPKCVESLSALVSIDVSSTGLSAQAVQRILDVPQIRNVRCYHSGFSRNQIHVPTGKNFEHSE